MVLSDYISISAIVVTAVIALVGGTYKILTDTKKYELSEQYKRELLTWYGKTIFLISEIQHIYREEIDTEDKKVRLLGELSALIEIGRFYFPNVDKKDGYGKNKSLAYRGYRNVVLDLLVLIYEISQKGGQEQISRLDSLAKEFTSLVFGVINPRERLNNVEKYTDIVKPQEMSIEDFLTIPNLEKYGTTIWQYYR